MGSKNTSWGYLVSEVLTIISLKLSWKEATKIKLNMKPSAKPCKVMYEFFPLFLWKLNLEICHHSTSHKLRRIKKRTIIYSFYKRNTFLQSNLYSEEKKLKFSVLVLELRPYPASRGPFDLPRKGDYSRKIEETSARRLLRPQSLLCNKQQLTSLLAVSNWKVSLIEQYWFI